MSLGQLSNLETLRVTGNLLVGFLSEIHFTKLKNLTYLALSYNSLELDVSSQWIPPFQLQWFYAVSCNTGPHFPNWLQTQTNLQEINLSNSSIKDTIPEWFENISSHIFYMDLSHNQIYGKLPPFNGYTHERFLMWNSNNLEGSLTSFPSNVYLLDLSDNLLSGHVPKTNGTMIRDLSHVNLSKNRFTGSIPVHLCQGLFLSVLDLSHNMFSGSLPRSLGKLKELEVIDLTNNTISGVVPSSFGYLKGLKSLHLHNNRLEGYLPVSLQNLTSMVTLDLGNNLLTGGIPSWIGLKLSKLRFLNLESNKFTGKIPLQLCQLSALQYLSLADNNIIGTIPRCLGNLSVMTTDQVSLEVHTSYEYEENILASIKGREMMYTTARELLTSLNLSSNKIVGEFLDDIMNLVLLINLNLSRNLLTGQIPMAIRNLNLTESLDLSMNTLSGRIPQILSSLNFLSHLNLSFNNLSGPIPIPVGNQMQTLNDLSIYEGNMDLCGLPLLSSCKENGSSYSHVVEDEGEDDNEGSWFYIGMGPGFVIGFIGLLGSLHFIRSWRLVYFRSLENVYNWLTLTLLLNLAQLRRKFTNRALFSNGGVELIQRR